MKLPIKSSIAGKLIGGFMVVVAMSVLIGGISYNQFRATEALISDEVMGKAEARYLNSQLILKSTFVFGLVNDYLLTTEESKRVALRIVIHDGIRTLGEYLRQVKSRKLTVEEREAFSRLEGIFSRYGNLTKRVLRRYDPEEDPGYKIEDHITEVERVVEEFREVHFRFITLLQNFNSIETEMMYDAWDFARQKIHTITILILTFSIAALVLGVFLGIVSTRMITVPVGRLVNTLEEYGSGNFDVRADVTGDDEVGFLAERFNVMLDRIKKYSVDLEQANRDLTQRNIEFEQRVIERTAELESVNKELEAFAYSVSHDLRAPLRAIDGFSMALLEDYQDKLDDTGNDYLVRVRTASQRMADLIDHILKLSRLTRREIHYEKVNLSELAQGIAEDMQRSQPGRSVDFVIADGVVANGDPVLLRIILENLLGNAWKFTEKHTTARIEVGVIDHEGVPAYFVRDDGAGFDMTYSDKLYGMFQRLHATGEFEGDGIGLATVQRVIHRHGGGVWAEGAVGQGATFYFTLHQKAKG